MRKLLFPALLLLASSAYSKTTTYDWSGTVKEPAWKASLGELVSGTLTLDDSGELGYEDETTKTYLSAKLSIWTGGRYYERTSYYSWSVYNGGQGTSNLTMDGDDYASLDFGIACNTASFHNLDQEFAGGGWGIVDQNSDNWYGDVTSLVRRGDPIGDDTAPVPGPGGLASMISALLGLGGFRLWRRRRV